MAYRLDAFSDIRLDEALLQLVLDEHRRAARPRLDTLWMYYRNTLRPVAPSRPAALSGAHGGPGSGLLAEPGRWYRLGQEAGLPTRIAGRSLDSAARRDVVVENDIGWRIQAMVDFMLGKPVKIVSTAPDDPTLTDEQNTRARAEIEQILDAVWEASGGIALLQDAALLGNVFGHVDLVLRIGDGLRARRGALPAVEPGQGDHAAMRRVFDAIEHLRIEIVDPRRGVPILSERDYRRLDAYVIHYERDANDARTPSVLDRILRRRSRLLGGRTGARPDAKAPDAPPIDAPARRVVRVTEIISASAWHVYEDGELVWQSNAHSLLSDTNNHADDPRRANEGGVPVVHIQNISQPFQYGGMSEVEPLIPLQDELNTRLSDRANRVALQSFKMYLAKGIDGFDRVPVAPGTVWTTDNPDASIQAFGGDADSPSEETHITEIREALDKISGVPPIASGVVRAKIGNLSSANALKITLMGVLSKTARKRITYGRGIAQMSSMILAALDAAGVYRTSPMQRAVRLDWPDPLPEDRRETIWAAQAKARLGVPQREVLRELDQTPDDAGIN